MCGGSVHEAPRAAEGEEVIAPQWYNSHCYLSHAPNTQNTKPPDMKIGRELLSGRRDPGGAGLDNTEK